MPDAPSHELPTGPLGVHLDPSGTGAAVAIHAAHADGVEVALLDPLPGGGWSERRVPLARARHDVWSGRLEGVVAGQHYGLRVAGPWDPARGHRHDPASLLLDPYARAVAGEVTWGAEVFAHAVDPDTWRPVPGPHRPSGLDSAAHVPHGVLVPAATADPAARPRTPWSRTVLYEAHVRGLTMLHPDVPEEQRGTYAGLAHPAVLEHLVGLGVTAVELLPVHASASEPHLVRRGAVNYWGYNTLSWFAPEPRYATAAARAAGPAAVVEELRAAVAALHAAGLEVVLDVVYNHSCEGGSDGPTFGLRGLDAASYYRLDEHGWDVDTTGCGNSLDASHPRVVQLFLDSLRHWVRTYGIDGFRFDLAPTMARGASGHFHAEHAFLVAAAADPELADVKLIAEPWDVGPDGWVTGAFPAPFAEWNDRFRNGSRDFWLAQAGCLARGEQPGHGLRELATRLTGSTDLYGGRDRGPLASVNFVTAHDGFTLADSTAFEHKHNLANGEDGRDGSDDNRTWNHGAEGWTEVGEEQHGPLAAPDPGAPPPSAAAAAPVVVAAPAGPAPAAPGASVLDAGAPAAPVAAGGALPATAPAAAVVEVDLDPDRALRDALRQRSMRNLLATLLLSAGVPMITAGDEMGRSQGGNNNPYCLDDATSWVSWSLAPWQEDLLATTRALTRLRREHPALRPVRPVTGAAVHEDGTTDRAWFAADGGPMVPERWDDVHERTVQVFAHGALSGGPSLLLVLHGGLDDAAVVLPPAPWGRSYRPLWDSAADRPAEPAAPTGTAPASPRAHLLPVPRLLPGASLLVSALSIQVLEVDRP